jgi:hypothetical protein
LLYVDPCPAPTAFPLDISFGPNENLEVDYQLYPPFLPFVKGVFSSVPNKFLCLSCKYFSLKLT